MKENWFATNLPVGAVTSRGSRSHKGGESNSDKLELHCGGGLRFWELEKSER
jgi:hypothetical protein